MRARIEFVLAVIVFAGLLFVNQKISEEAVSGKVNEAKALIIIDPGHGGADPGKVAVNGTMEKDINLSIAKKLKQLLEIQGIEVMMTREEDKMLSDEDSTNKKREDMNARVSMIDHSMPELTVSIHQNSYSDVSAKGAQVFYHMESKEGKKAAEIMQNSLVSLDENNHRQAKGNAEYYLLKHTDTPVIIVECGFLSNLKEADLLATEEYQEDMAEAISEGIVRYLERK